MRRKLPFAVWMSVLASVTLTFAVAYETPVSMAKAENLISHGAMAVRLVEASNSSADIRITTISGKKYVVNATPPERKAALVQIASDAAIPVRYTQVGSKSSLLSNLFAR